MPLDVDALLANETRDIPFSYSDRDSILYALSVGMGRSLDDAKSLRYMYEHKGGAQTLPTMASVLVPNLFPPDLGWDYAQVLHLDQRLILHRPLPPATALLINKRITDVFDRGGSRGALVAFEAEGRLAKDDTALFTIGSTILARGDGGCGAPKGRTAPPHPIPSRDADLNCLIDTTLEQALLYRLNGDRNPLHADPALAKAAGFERPILHGLCTYGIACHAILKTICDYDHTLIREFDARFAAPVLPGDTIRTEMWQDGNVISFQCVVDERQSTVIKGGRCVLAS